MELSIILIFLFVGHECVIEGSSIGRSAVSQRQSRSNGAYFAVKGAINFKIKGYFNDAVVKGPTNLEQRRNRVVIATYNINRVFRNMVPHDPNRAEHLVGAILDLGKTGDARKFGQPDILILQEVFEDEALKITEELRSVFPFQTARVGDCSNLESFSSSKGHCKEFFPGKFINGGVQILSKFKILSSDAIIVNDFLGMEGLANKGALKVKLSAPNGAIFHVVGTHLQSTPNWPGEMVARATAATRSKQLAAILDWVEELGVPWAEPVVLGGDLNIAFGSDEANDVFSAFPLATSHVRDNDVGGSYSSDFRETATNWINVASCRNDADCRLGLQGCDVDPLEVGVDRQCYLTTCAKPEEAVKLVLAFLATKPRQPKPATEEEKRFGVRDVIELDSTLDYVCHLTNHRQPEVLIKAQVIPLKSSKSWFWAPLKGTWKTKSGLFDHSGFYSDVSDHYPVMAAFRM